MPSTRLPAAELNGEIVGTVQMLILPNLSHLGRPIAQLESMHVVASHRGNRIGEEMIRCAVAEAKLHGCFRMQLTSNKVRHDAHRFYKRLGFEASHEGFKLSL
jgi:GNAT superfamily N-acetyltransferase